MFGDRKARTRSYQTIESLANRVRAISGLSAHAKFDPVGFIIGPLMLRIMTNLDLLLYDDQQYHVPAFVRFHEGGTKITLNVRKSVWTRAKAGFALDIYILCHEIGHILMHSHDELAYSEAIPSIVARFPESERTEPQANLFADLVLIQEMALNEFYNAEEIAEYFNVPIECAQRRFDYICDKKRRSHKPLTGDVCSYCANFTVVRVGVSLKCETCQRTVGLV